MLVTLYGMDEELNVVEGGAVSLERAHEVIDSYFSRLQPHYATGEEALAQTMFGFSKPTGSFVELCIHSLSQVAFKFESATLYAPRWGSRPYEFEATLRSRDDVVTAVDRFFMASDEEFRSFVEQEYSR